MRLAQLALTVIVTWFILDRVGLGLADLGAVDPATWTPEPVRFAASCLLLFGGYVASAAIWGRMVQDLGGPAIPVRRSVPIFMVANLGRYVPGKVWQIAGLAVLARREGVDPVTSTGAAVLGHGIALVAATLVGLGAILAGPGAWQAWAPWVAATLAVGLVVGLLPPVFRRLARLWFRLAKQEDPGTLGSGRGVAWLVAYIANWMVYAASFWVLAVSLGLDGPPLAVASAFAAAYVLGYVMIFAPAGVGVREGFLVALLTPHMGAAPAGVLAVVARVWTTGVEVVPAAAFWLGHMRKTAGREAPETERGGRG